MFRLIALKVLDDCAACAHKVLAAGTLYKFCNEFTEDAGNQFLLIRNKDKSAIENNLYNSNKSKTNITINAIVGQNGDGKSSIVELLIRVLNNFACCFGYKHDQDSLCYNISVSAILYYEIDEHIYSIFCPISRTEIDNGKYWVKWYKDGKCVSDDMPIEDETGEKRKAWLKENHADELFYGMVINYSIYSYNSRLLGQENEGNSSWIDSLFHKNDSYQTPIVLNPMRADGNIDINREEYLSHQRLMAIYTQAGDDASQRMVGEDKEAIGYAFSLEKESKLLLTTIKEYFKRNHQQDFPWANLEHYIAHRDRLYVTEVEAEAVNILCSHFADFWVEFQELLGHSPKFQKYVEDLSQKDEMERSHPSDLNKYLRFIFDWMKEVQHPRFSEIHKGLWWFIVSKFEWINYAEFYRMTLVLVVWEQLRELCDVIDCSIDEAIRNRKKPKFAAKLYVCYKVIEILMTYLPYYKRSYVSDETYEMLCNPISKNISFARMKSDIAEILLKDDYTTLKLHQAINYIKYQENEYYAAEQNKIANYYYLARFGELNKSLKRVSKKSGIDNIIQLLPPPIFVGQILFQSNDEQKFEIRSLSSGELQKLNSVGTFLYHLRNLDYKQTEANKLSYKNIFVVFEEVELYFHPEYQKSFVDYLTTQLNRLKLDNIENVNILFVSHSPFILTDVLTKNTLYLKEGKPYECKEETFASNLYDLMYDSFFLTKNAMGDCASRYVNSIIEKKKREGELRDDEIEIVGDPILKNFLQS